MKNIRLETEKFEAMSTAQVQEHEVQRLTEDLAAGKWFHYPFLPSSPPLVCMILVLPMSNQTGFVILATIAILSSIY